MQRSVGGAAAQETKRRRLQRPHAHKSGQVAVAHISTSARPNFSCVARLGVCPSVPEEERRGGWQLRDVLAGFASAPSPAWLAEAAV